MEKITTNETHYKIPISEIIKDKGLKGQLKTVILGGDNRLEEGKYLLIWMDENERKD